MASAGVASAWSFNPLGAQDPSRKPLRLITFVDHYGLSPHGGDRTGQWMTSESGDFALSEEHFEWVLAPMARHQAHMAVITGVWQRSRAVLGGSAAHFAVNAQALTGSRGRGGRSSGIRHDHPSIDVHIGEFLSGDYGLRDRVYPHVRIGGSFSYGTDGAKLGGLGSPRAVYSSLFGATSLVDLQTQALVMEQVQRQLQTIRPQLVNANAATMLDGYASSVDAVARELELRADLVCEQPDSSSNNGATEAGVRQMFTAIYNMIGCDLTSSIAYAFSGSQRHQFLFAESPDRSGAVRTALGRSYHNPSHNNGTVGAMVQSLVYRWRLELLADLIDRLAETPDVGGDTLLDNTVILFTSAMSNNTHGTRQGYPQFIVAGRNANLNTGMHFDCTGHSNNELFVTLAQGLFAPTARFGGYNGSGVYRGAALNNGPIEKLLKEVVS